MANAPGTVYRNIYFYRLDWGTDDAGLPLSGTLKPSLDRLSGLGFNESGRYLRQADGNVYCAWVDNKRSPRKLRFATIRHVGLPLVETLGKLKNLPISADEGLYDPVHAVIFADDVVGVEFNFYGPRAGRLPFYLSNVCAAPDFEIIPLLRQDSAMQLRAFDEIRLFDLEIRRNWLEEVAAASPALGRIFRGAFRAGQPQLARVILKPEGRNKGWLDRSILGAARNISRRSDLSTGATKFEVVGRNRSTLALEDIDVLREHLVARKAVIKQGALNRAINSSDAYRAIEEAYEEMKNEIVAAAGIAIV